jgi:hypothetical protein
VSSHPSVRPTWTSAGNLRTVLLGLASGGVCLAAVSPRRRCALTAPFQPCLCETHVKPRHRRCVSVALSRGFPRVGVPTTSPCDVRTFLDGLSVPPRLLGLRLQAYRQIRAPPRPSAGPRGACAGEHLDPWAKRPPALGELGQLVARMRRVHAVRERDRLREAPLVGCQPVRRAGAAQHDPCAVNGPDARELLQVGDRVLRRDLAQALAVEPALERRLRERAQVGELALGHAGKRPARRDAPRRRTVRSRGGAALPLGVRAGRAAGLDDEAGHVAGASVSRASSGTPCSARRRARRLSRNAGASRRRRAGRRPRGAR